MAIGKRALFFTLLSVVLVVVMIAFFMPNYDTYSYMSKVPTLKTRFVKANDFVSGLYGEVGTRVLAYSSYSALKALNEHIDATNRPLGNLRANFSEVVMNGTLNRANIPSMDNKTIQERFTELSRLGLSELGLRSNISISGIEIYQSEETGYDRIGIAMNLTVQLDAGIAEWNVTNPVNTTIDIGWLYDPYYIMNFEYDNKVLFSNISNWSATGVGDVFYQIDSIKYTFEPDAPSFLMRFENSTSNSSCCGIESFINPVELGITTSKDVSYVDYCFFNTTPRDSCGYSFYSMHNFTHLSNVTVNQKFYGFKLEIYHINKYNLSEDIGD